MLINTGNANAGTGADGMARAQATCEALAGKLGLVATSVLPFSHRRHHGAAAARAHHLPGWTRRCLTPRRDNWLRAAEGIMTTDTVPKAFSTRVQLGGASVTVTGISKGAGMIRPNMATMLGFCGHRRLRGPGLMKQLALELAEGSFNRVTVGWRHLHQRFFRRHRHQQGCARAHHVAGTAPEGQLLRAAMLEVARQLAQAIVRDGEGATKFITVRVEGGKTAEECRLAAYAIAHSPLVKTAFFASDPNLGRILAAVGYAGIADLDQAGIDLFLDDVHVVGQRRGATRPTARKTASG